MLIPVIAIPVKSNFTLNNAIDRFTLTTGQLIQGEAIMGNSNPLYTCKSVLTVVFIIISSVLLIRFLLNILRISRKILKSKKVDNLKTSIVFVEERTLPYSFFRYIFVNQSDFENGKIEKELLMHEEAHCLQYHSIDIMLIELLRVFLWFNPAIWLIRKSILLNHEYYADDKVLTDNDPADYQRLLLNMLLRNGPNYLVSNFKYSLIKSRINMMTIGKPLHNAILRKFSAIALFLIMAITLTFCQKIKEMDTGRNLDNEWWASILKKHNIIPGGFNNFEKVFEMGTTNSINNRIVTLDNAFFLLKPEGDEYYTILKSPKAFHDLEKNIIRGEEGTMETYSLKSIDNKPLSTALFSRFEYQIENHGFFAEYAKFDMRLQNNNR